MQRTLSFRLGAATISLLQLGALHVRLAEWLGLAEEPLAAGEVVTTGTLTPAFPVAPGQQRTATVDGLDLAPRTLTLL
jgi:hypothetical protein